MASIEKVSVVCLDVSMRLDAMNSGKTMYSRVALNVVFLGRRFEINVLRRSTYFLHRRRGNRTFRSVLGTFTFFRSLFGEKVLPLN